ncbi:acyl-homoserine-lactone synthase [Pseudogemmobacter faecipullorum]|uniref:Acyl-homoserine-lactone synthase n=1 Tax=Pseudogemmobacter faecipullorum TaxID=2755041 RepID=A0ABS8CH77_9RHOB|nr:acyl-homoserine-lactone synthase [Pseudogemmobacter faecipullorum]MCB5408747.1 GNAT family N-acetyltransferase [Pseudogemmobacter faecipullorum]
MIIVIDAINKHLFSDLLDEMFLLRGRVFGERLGWEVTIENGREIDQFDAMDPLYLLGLDEDGEVISCVRTLQTTGPHMLSDVFSSILDGEPPIRSSRIWESTRFCVDTARLTRDGSASAIARATSELMIATLETSRDAGITDIITVIDPVMNRVLKRSDNAPYDYVGSVTPMGKVSALAALLDCTDERIERVRAFAGISGRVLATEEEVLALRAAARMRNGQGNHDRKASLPEPAAVLAAAHAPASLQLSAG